MTTPSTDAVNVAGLEIPRALYSRIVAAIRGLYPEVAGSKADDDVLRAFLIYTAGAAMAQWESQQVVQAGEAEIALAREKQTRQAELARGKALRDSMLGIKVTVPPVEPVAE